MFQELMIDLDHKGLMEQLDISWGPGDKYMPADDWSRFQRQDTMVQETALFPDPVDHPGYNSIPVHQYVANSLVWWADTLTSR